MDGAPGDGGADAGMALSPLAAAYLDALLTGDRNRAVQLVVDAAAEGRPVRELYDDVLTPVQREVGRLWQRDEITVATEHYCTAVTQLALSRLHPYVFGTPRNGLRLVATTVQGNLHELGIRMVSDLFELEGWDTYYLGANTPPDAVTEAVAHNAADLVLLSATLPEHVDAVRDVVTAVRADPRTGHVPILVGGPPFVHGTAADVGADAVAMDATSGLARARELVVAAR